MTAIQDIPVAKIDGAPAKLADYKGKVLLVVNVASKCGLTPQYEGLEKLYEEKRAKGLEVLGFPANNFGGQEPGTNEEIADFCQTKFDVKFPMFSKISVKGADQHPLYEALTRAQPKAVGGDAMLERFKAAGRGPANEADVMWNFEKFLIGRSGEVVARFAPPTAPNDPALNAAIDAELAKGA
jgi:glutathione peroxidase